MRAGWKVEGCGSEWSGKAGPRDPKEEWALSVASPACQEERHVSRGVKEGLLWVFGRNGGKQQQRP